MPDHPTIQIISSHVANGHEPLELVSVIGAAPDDTPVDTLSQSRGSVVATVP